MRHFPEGGIEFVIVTRVLLVFGLLALAVIRETQRPLVLLALSGVLWVDYLLTLGWAVQMAMDIEELQEGVSNSGAAPNNHRLLTIVLAALPSLFALLILAPWPERVWGVSTTREAIMSVLMPTLIVLYGLTVIVAAVALRRVDLGSLVWTALLLVPVLHLWALNRIVAHLGRRLKDISPAPKEGADDDGPNVSIVLADITWLLAVLPWIYITIQVARNVITSRLTPTCGTLLVGLFVVAQVAAMEGVQRRFVETVRRL
ncbi:MAG: hypothetical protein AMXMBFR13_42500 [Phycisphaerae bacterium]